MEGTGMNRLVTTVVPLSIALADAGGGAGMRTSGSTVLQSGASRCSTVVSIRSTLRLLLIGIVSALPVAPAVVEGPALVVEGEGFASNWGAGRFTATLPDGSKCTVGFSGGKISLFGKSATKGVGTCIKGRSSQPIRFVVLRRLNGSPREATLTFNDGTKVLVTIPREKAKGALEPIPPESDAVGASAPPLPETQDPDEDLVAPSEQ